jgi:DinB family protein
MNRLFFSLVATSCSLSAFAADSTPMSAGKIFDRDLTTIERDIVPLAEAMPAGKYNFAPTSGEFKGVRTFGEQMKHVAAVIYMVSASVLGEKNPDTAGSENGPASMKTKDEIVKYLKDSFVYAHRAMGSLTDNNLTDMVTSAFGSDKVPRVSMATVAAWHSFDHYGQCVVYARMNGIVPPASRR